MNNILNLSSCTLFKRKLCRWTASLLVMVILAEQMPTAWANDTGSEISTQRSEASQLIKTIFNTFSQPDSEEELSRHEAEFKKFEIEFNEKLEAASLSGTEAEFLAETLGFMNGFMKLYNFRSLKKVTHMAPQLGGAHELQLEVELPENQEIKKLAENLIKKWKTSHLIDQNKPFDWDYSYAYAALSAHYFQIATIIIIMAYCNIDPKFKHPADSVCSTESEKLGIIGYGMLGVYFVSIACILKKSSDLKSYFDNRGLKKTLDELNDDNRIMIDEISAKYGIPHLGQMILKLIDVRTLARPAWNEDEPCPICCEGYETQTQSESISESESESETKTEIEVTLCSHKYHKKCIRRVQDSSKKRGIDFTCPICRKVLTPYTVASEEFEDDFSYMALI